MNRRKPEEKQAIWHAKQLAEEKDIEHGFFEELFSRIVKYVRKD